MSRLSNALQATFLTLCLLALSGYFWLFSRYPDLFRKSDHALDKIAPFTLWPKIEVNPTDPYLTRVLLTNLNWLDTNRKGMIFGLVVAALFLAIFRRLSTLKIGPKTQTLSGAVFGAALGLCVNCATPVMFGLVKARRVRAAFILMFTSPMLNPVVLSMSFGLFPDYLAGLKLGLSVVFIFLFLPLVLHLLKDLELPERSDGVQDELFSAPRVNPHSPSSPRYYAFELVAVVELFLSSLWSIGKWTVPAMILGGLLGSAIVLAFDLSQFSTGFWGILAFNTIGTLLPLPMAFDIILSKNLYDHGLAPALTSGLLFCGGSFSIYPLLLIYRYVSRRLSLILFAAIVAFGTVSSLLAEAFYNSYYLKQNLTYFDSKLPAPQSAVVPTTAKPFTRAPRPQTEIYRDQQVKILATALAERPAGTEPFSRLEGADLGIDQGFTPGTDDLHEPFWWGRGTAAGDINNDGWPDIVLGSKTGPKVYLNQRGNFSAHLLNLDLPESSQDSFVVALVDLNNDGWLDLFFSTYGHGNFVLWNDNGSLADSRPVPLPGNDKALVTLSAAFYDVDQNSTLDWVDGNFSFGFPLFYYQKTAPLELQRNSFVLNQNGRFSASPLAGTPGETLTTLFSKMIPGQGVQLYVGNDYDAADLIYGIKDGRPALLSKGEHPFTNAPWDTMSVDTGDLNNDLILDSFISSSTEVFSAKDNVPEIYYRAPLANVAQKHEPELCAQIHSPVDRERCDNLAADIQSRQTFFDARKKADLGYCPKQYAHNAPALEACLNFNMFLLAYTENQAALCEKITARSSGLKDYCLRFFADKPLSQANADSGISSAFKATHHLYLSGSDGSLANLRANSKVDTLGIPLKMGWTWNAKIADLDDDGFQDIFVVNGSVISRTGWNYFLKNNGGHEFSVRQFDYNLFDYFDYHSYSLVDLDGDGDLDIVLNSFQGPVRIFRNNSQRAALNVELRDSSGNRFGIGAQITIEYADGKKQIRELKAGGGYMSFDPPVAHFGLNDVTEISRLDIQTSRGRHYSIKHRLPTSNHYVIELSP